MNSYSEFPPPDRAIAARDPRHTLDYLCALPIVTPFDMTVFLHQVRAARPDRCYEHPVLQSPSLVTLCADSALWRENFDWCSVKAAVENTLQAFIGNACLPSVTLNEMIATCLLSEFLGCPVICEWSADALDSSALGDPSPLQMLFPWDSQLWIHCCAEPDDRERVLDCGLNPALVVCDRDIGDRHDLLTRLCPENAHKLARDQLDLHKALASSGDNDFLAALCTRTPYTPGLNWLGFFSRAQSSQDSTSFFREEQELRRRMFREGTVSNASSTLLHAIDTLFALESGRKLSAVSDCSFAYRHRSRRDREYTHLTEPELRGLVRHMVNTAHGPDENQHLDGAVDQAPTGLDGQALIRSLAGGSLAELDDSPLILRQLRTIDVPLAVFVDGSPIEALLLFVLLPLALRLKPNEGAKPIYVFTSTRRIYRDGIDYRLLKLLIARNALLRRGVEAGLLHIVPTLQIAEGINVRQIGTAAQRILLDIKVQEGVLMSSLKDALMTLKSLSLPWINVGRASCDQVVALSGLKQGDGYAIMHSPPAPLFIGFPIVNRTMLQIREGRRPAILRSRDRDITREPVYGETSDGTPFSGILIRVLPAARGRYQLEVEVTPQPKPLPLLVEQYQCRTGRQVVLAWNGGYFISPGFQEKQGFPPAFQGKPVGLVKVRGRLFCLPLFDRRPVLALGGRGEWAIKTLKVGRVEIGVQGYDGPLHLAQYCGHLDSGTLRRDEITLYGIQGSPPVVPEGYVAIRFLFDEILQVLDGSESHCQLAVPHYTLVLPKSRHSRAWKVGARLCFDLVGYDEYHTMIEAGPQLVRDGRPCLDLVREGWTDPRSKALQAAPVHFEDLRTARTVFCTLVDGGLATLTINSRADESTGLTHAELCNLIQEKLPGQVQNAIEFDSGGSVTLLSGQELLNICSTLGLDDDGRGIWTLARPIATAILLTKA